MQQKYSFTKTRIRYSETDQMGVVYHGNYAQYFEMGRTEWLRSLGVAYKYMEINGIILPVISLDIKYLKSAYYDEVLTIKTSLKKRPLVKISFDYEITNEHNELICTGNTELAFLDAKTKKPVKCPDALLKLLK
ncbi:acyl-CoA thioesterase [Polaribacter tangerinus]|uniref:acyl-CoA thioesterase n=1 Tax=Polaribacter tangerinus TaxID=1920034 RepID=UPI000B4B7603|nr:thioesterase family protein [Polaribacter tangerinus]